MSNGSPVKSLDSLNSSRAKGGGAGLSRAQEKIPSKNSNPQLTKNIFLIEASFL
jgi:hypothetical protein